MTHHLDIFMSVKKFRLNGLIMKMPALPQIAAACQLIYYSFKDGLGKSSYWEDIMVKERNRKEQSAP